MCIINPYVYLMSVYVIFMHLMMANSMGSITVLLF